MAEEGKISSGSLSVDRAKVKEAFNSAVSTDVKTKAGMSEVLGTVLVGFTLAVILLMGIKALSRKINRQEDEDNAYSIAKTVLLVVVLCIGALAYIAMTTARN